IACLSPPHVCLSAMEPPCPEVRFIAFNGTSTSLDEAAQTKMSALATEAKQQGAHIYLSVKVFDDGQAAAAAELHQTRLDAVLTAAKDLGLAEQVSAAPIDASAVAM